MMDLHNSRTLCSMKSFTMFILVLSLFDLGRKTPHPPVMKDEKVRTNLFQDCLVTRDLSKLYFYFIMNQEIESYRQDLFYI
jgi:hypothetical protein